MKLTKAEVRARRDARAAGPIVFSTATLPTPYYDDGQITIYHAKAEDIILSLPTVGVAVVSDPPYNIGYKYEHYSDDLSPMEYQTLLLHTFRPPSVMLHYPEAIVNFCAQSARAPERCVSWVYHANTPHQWRMIAWFGCQPDFSRMKQPYQNPTDARIRGLIESGSAGSDLYDWWLIEQVKNVSEEKCDHPCQIPLPIMERIIAITPFDIIVDPFMGSGTSLVAAKKYGRRAIGVETNERYCEIAVKRLGQEYLDLDYGE